VRTALECKGVYSGDPRDRETRIKVSEGENVSKRYIGTDKLKILWRLRRQSSPSKASQRLLDKDNNLSALDLINQASDGCKSKELFFAFQAAKQPPKAHLRGHLFEG
jgi:hypothetical protein